MRFDAKVYSAGAGIEALSLEAEDEGGASHQLRRDGYRVLSIRPAGGAVFARLQAAGSRFPLALFSQQLGALLDAGLPLVDAIDTLVDTESRAPHRAVLRGLAAALRMGKPFSAALAEQPEAFPSLFVAVVRSSERSGSVSEALRRYVGYQDQLERVRARIVGASVYPAVLGLVGGAVVLFLLFYVVPRFGRIYEDRAAQLGWAAELVLGAAKAAEGLMPFVLALLLLAAAAGAAAARNPAVRRRLLGALLRLRPLRERARIFQLARFYRTAGMLLGGGFTAIAAFDLAAPLLDPPKQQRLRGAIARIAEGQPISRAMEAAGLTSAVAGRLLAVGEQGGGMAEMMRRIGDFHDEEVARWIDWFARLFEPLLMTAIGIGIGAIVVLMYMPVFELAGGLR
jgi:general secretion pathway protein F